MRMRLHEAARALGVEVGIDDDPEIACICTDSRKGCAGGLFVALRGERFDGHDFVAEAKACGAVAALVDAQWARTQPQVGVPLLVVEDCRRAFGALAAWWRSRFDIPVVGVTGSNGKTTVKEMCAAILRAQAQIDGHDADVVLATSGNLNNDIGVPQTLFRLDSGHRAAIIEMGMNRPGEIAYLTALVRPTVAMVNNAQRAHLLGMGTVASIAEEKGAIYGGLDSAGVAVINADDPHADYWRELNTSRRTLSFGLGGAAQVSGRCTLHGLGSELVLDTPAGAATVILKVPGEHNARNALGAAAACLAAGAGLRAVVRGLSAYTGTRGRLERRDGLNGAIIVDDSYNANPDSVRAGIDVLAATPGRKLLVLGDMGEMGGSRAQVHDEIGGYAKSKGVDALFALGEMSAVAVRNFGHGGRHFKSIDALVAALKPQLDARTVVLVKGSRLMGMERVVAALAAAQDSPAVSEGGTHAA